METKRIKVYFELSYEEQDKKILSSMEIWTLLHDLNRKDGLNLKNELFLFTFDFYKEI